MSVDEGGFGREAYPEVSVRIDGAIEVIGGPHAGPLVMNRDTAIRLANRIINAVARECGPYDKESYPRVSYGCGGTVSVSLTPLRSWLLNKDEAERLQLRLWEELHADDKEPANTKSPENQEMQPPPQKQASAPGDMRVVSRGGDLFDVWGKRGWVGCFSTEELTSLASGFAGELVRLGKAPQFPLSDPKPDRCAAKEVLEAADRVVMCFDPLRQEFLPVKDAAAPLPEADPNLTVLEQFLSVTTHGELVIINGSKDPSAPPLVLRQDSARKLVDHLLSVLPQPGQVHVDEASKEMFDAMNKQTKFRHMAIEKLSQDIAAVINRHNQESPSNTPDFILSDLLVDVLHAYNRAVVRTREWYGEPRHKDPQPPTPLDAAPPQAKEIASIVEVLNSLFDEVMSIAPEGHPTSNWGVINKRINELRGDVPAVNGGAK